MSNAMQTAEYLRRQASNCLRVARECFDLAAAERLRHVATDLKLKAAELEDEDNIAPHMLRNDSPSTRGNDRG